MVKSIVGVALKSCSSSVHVTSLQEFENDLCEFNQRVEDLDRRLGTVFSQAFDDAPDLEHAFKVCGGVGGALLCSILPTLSAEEGKDPLPTVLFLAESNCSCQFSREVLWVT